MTNKLEMSLEQFSEAVAKENTRLREALEYIAEGGKGNILRMLIKTFSIRLVIR